MSVHRAWTCAALLAALAALFAPGGAAAAEDRVAVGAYIPGATEKPKRIDAYARKTGKRPAIVLIYRKWDGHPLFDEPTLGSVTRRKAVPLITWEPWRHSLRDIAAGRYDRYLRGSAREARRWGRVVMVRFAHEMNGDWYPWGVGVRGNTARDFVGAWRRIVRIFRHERARNVHWVWAPNADDEGRAAIPPLYPGDRFVDWVGLSGFSWGGPWEWESASQIFRRTYNTLTRMTNKPLMLAETAAGEDGGDKARWIRETFERDLPSMARIRAVIWFNGTHNWAHWDVDSSPASLAAFRDVVAAPRYSAGRADLAALGRPPWCCGERRTAVAAWG